MRVYKSSECLICSVRHRKLYRVIAKHETNKNAEAKRRFEFSLKSVINWKKFKLFIIINRYVM